MLFYCPIVGRLRPVALTWNVFLLRVPLQINFNVTLAISCQLNIVVCYMSARVFVIQLGSFVILGFHNKIKIL